jgi:hypothetical protein
MKNNIWDDGQEQLHDDLLDLTIIGASHIANGLTDFSAWSKAMLSIECRQDVRPFLRVVFANSKDMFKRMSKLFERQQ